MPDPEGPHLSEWYFFLIIPLILASGCCVFGICGILARDRNINRRIRDNPGPDPGPPHPNHDQRDASKRVYVIVVSPGDEIGVGIGTATDDS